MNIYRFVSDGYLTYASAIDKISGWYLRHHDREMVELIDVSELEKMLSTNNSEEILKLIHKERSEYDRQTR